MDRGFAASKSTDSQRALPFTVLDIAFACLVFVVFSGLGQYAGALGLPPLLWLLIGVGLVGLGWLGKQGLTISLDRILVWLYAYVLIAAMWAFLSDDRAAAIDTLIQVINFAIIAWLMLTGISTASSYVAALWAVGISVVVGVALNIYEYFVPFSFYQGSERSAGMHLNPNTSGTALVFGMLLTRNHVRPKYRLLYELGVGCGVLLTFSRGAILCWLVAFAFTQVSQFRSSASYRELFRSWLVVCAAVVIVSLTPLGSSALQRLNEDGLTTEHNLDRLRFFETGQTEGESRVSLGLMALEKFWENPFLGFGTGSALFEFEGLLLGPHNTYLWLAVQFGFIGLMLILGLFTAVWSASQAKRLVAPIVCVLGTAAFFSHTTLLQWHYPIIIVMAVRMHLGIRSHHSQEIQDAMGDRPPPNQVDNDGRRCSVESQ